jgi:hypothetical protein
MGMFETKQKKGAQMLVIQGAPNDDSEAVKLNGKYRQGRIVNGGGGFISRVHSREGKMARGHDFGAMRLVACWQ